MDGDNKLHLADVKRFFGTLPLMEVNELLNAANCDNEEGREWLPYYKMALSRLAECIGVLRTMSEQAPKCAHSENLLHKASRLWYQHLLLCGIGPQENPETIRRIEEKSAQEMGRFIDWK